MQPTSRQEIRFRLFRLLFRASSHTFPNRGIQPYVHLHTGNARGGTTGKAKANIRQNHCKSSICWCRFACAPSFRVSRAALGKLHRYALVLTSRSENLSLFEFHVPYFLHVPLIPITPPDFHVPLPLLVKIHDN